METVNVQTDDCFYCGKRSIIENVPTRALLQWQSGEAFIQDAFPDWSPAKRELLKSGIHPECWEAIMSDDDDELPIDE